MAKKIDLNKTVYELAKEYPEIVDIMVELGFTEIAKKPVLNSIGKMMTIPKGAKIKDIPMGDIVAALMRNGFELTGAMPDMSSMTGLSKAETKTSTPENRVEQLKSYLKRIGEGESLDSVKTDFVREFQQVEASEIMEAEQQLLKEGAPLSEVQRLCDIHSALFHGATTEEKIANAEKEVEASKERRKAEEVTNQDDPTGKKARAAELANTKGHPLYTLTRENNALKDLITKYGEEKDDTIITSLRQLSIHYSKKGNLIYPLLDVTYAISGPSDVMWTVDNEIRDEIGALAREKTRDEEWHKRLEAVLTRADEMIYKEQNILFPICAVNFTKEEWYGIYEDSKDYDTCLGITKETWQEAEEALKDKKVQGAEGEIVMPGGHLTVEQLRALLNTIPVEITFVDEDNINRFFNEGPKIFKRPGMAIDRDVFSCHPPKIEPMVRQMIDDFKNNRRDEVSVWMEKGGHTFLVKYMAVRDHKGKYVGTMELVQDMNFAKEHFLGSKE